MCHHPEPCWCAAGGFMLIRRVRRWRCAGSSSAKGQWRCPRSGIGRARARSEVRRIQSAVRCAGNGWCAWPWCPGRAHRPRQWPGSSRWPERPSRQGGLEAALGGGVRSGERARGCAGWNHRRYDGPERSPIACRSPTIHGPSAANGLNTVSQSGFNLHRWPVRAPDSVGGQSNMVLKPTAGRTGVLPACTSSRGLRRCGSRVPAWPAAA
jgi:hypothetical protein